MQSMEAARDRNFHIANEGLRLVLECKVPRFCSSVGYDQMVNLQREWSKKRLAHALPPMLDWADQHQQTLFATDGASPAVENFQKHFALVLLEQLSSFLVHAEFHLGNGKDFDSRFSKFQADVVRILTTNSVVRSWLLHHYGSELGLGGWKCRPGDLYSLYFLFQSLQRSEMGALFGPRMISFVEVVSKEMMELQQNKEYQGLGILLMASVVEVNNEMKNPTNDAVEIFKLALRLSVELGAEYDELWGIIYHCFLSIRVANYSPDMLMLEMLDRLSEDIIKKQDNPDGSALGIGPLTYLRAVTLLLLLDVPEVDLKEGELDEFTISGRECNRAELLRYVKNHLQWGDVRFPIDIRLRIAKMIPKLFAAFTSVSYINSQAYECLELLAWLTMFPFAETRQHQNARGFMLTRLLVEIKRLASGFITNQSEFSYGVEDLRQLHDNLLTLLAVVREGVRHLPNRGWFRRYKREMHMYVPLIDFILTLLKCYKEQVAGEEEAAEDDEM